jgi:hypothetical protein
VTNIDLARFIHNQCRYHFNTITTSNIVIRGKGYFIKVLGPAYLYDLEISGITLLDTAVFFCGVDDLHFGQYLTTGNILFHSISIFLCLILKSSKTLEIIFSIFLKPTDFM